MHFAWPHPIISTSLKPSGQLCRKYYQKEKIPHKSTDDINPRSSHIPNYNKLSIDKKFLVSVQALRYCEGISNTNKYKTKYHEKNLNPTHTLNMGIHTLIIKIYRTNCTEPTNRDCNGPNKRSNPILRWSKWTMNDILNNSVCASMADEFTADSRLIVGGGYIIR